MAQKKMRPASLVTATTGLGISLSSPDRNPEFSLSLSTAQAAFLARFGLDGPRARLTVELAGWRL